MPEAIAASIALWFVWLMSRNYVLRTFLHPPLRTAKLEPFPTLEAEKPSARFTPRYFSEYIGQEKSKSIFGQYILAAKERATVLPHILIHGKAGMGKTTLAHVLANEMSVPFREVITSEISSSQEIWEKIPAGGVLFLDEIHSIPRDIAEQLYQLMENFQQDGQIVSPFTLIGATTELGEIIKTRKPFYDRFQICVELEDYTESELVMMARQYRQRQFPKDEEPSDEIYTLLAKNSRATPRHLLRLLTATIFFKNNCLTVLKNFNIIADGYTEKDLKLLKYVQLHDTGVGVQALASFLETSAANYTFEMEPFLLKTGVLIRTPRGRKLTPAGVELIKRLQKV